MYVCLHVCGCLYVSFAQVLAVMCESIYVFVSMSVCVLTHVCKFLFSYSYWYVTCGMCMCKHIQINNNIST